MRDGEPRGTSWSRLVVFGAVFATARAVAWACVALWVTGDVSARGVLTWTGLALPVFGLTVLVELPFLVWESNGTRRRQVGVMASTGVVWGAVLALYLHPFRCVSGWGPLGLGVAGVVAGLGVRLPESGRRGWAWLGLLGIGAAIVGIAVADPEGRYAERYRENRLSLEELGAEPVVEGEPGSLTRAEVARAVATTWMRTHPAAELRFSWEEMVAVEGLLAYGRRYGDPAPAEYASAWVAFHSERAAEEPLWADAAAPAGVVYALTPALRGQAGRKFAERVWRFIREECPRTGEGVLSHLGVLAGGWLPAQAWVDSLFMYGTYLNRRFAEGDDAAGEEALLLGKGMIRSLQDEGTGLFRHALVDMGVGVVRLPVEGTYWARGNGWVGCFLVEHQVARAGRGLEPDPVLQEALGRLLDTVRTVQDESGLWPTDLSGVASEGNPLETSASALFVRAWARGIHTGVVTPEVGDAERLQRARAALRERIRWDSGHPVLEGTSTGTSPGFRRAYRTVPRDENVGHGVGALLLALSADE